MSKNEAIVAAKKNGLFKNYPKVNEWHITTDGQGFQLKSDAESHAVTLDKKNPIVVTVNRDDKETGEKSEKATDNLSAKEIAEKKVEDGKAGVNLAEQGVANAITTSGKQKAEKKLESAKETLKAAEQELAGISE